MGTAHEIGPTSPRDALLLPLTSSDGSRLGILAAVTGGDDEPPATIRNALHACAVPAALAIEHATQRSRAEASERALLHQAMSDPLTGVGTRTLLLERLRHATTARPESRAAMALVFIDLDHFKVINDHHTHAVGDRVLRTVAQRIETAVRAHDTVARWGGDEFLVLLHPLADEHSALGAVKRVLATIAEPIVEGGLTLTVTASIGVTFWTSAQPVDVEEMVRRADAAMYEAKDNGGDCFSLFEALDAQSSRHLHLDDLLSRAVVEDRVVVHYQPIVRVADHGVVGVEALLRLRDDDGALVYPDELLRHGAPPGDVARELMLRACTDVACWVGQGHDLWLALNVAAPQVADVDGFVDDVSKALASPGLAPERLTLELTEHTLLNTSAQDARRDRGPRGARAQVQHRRLRHGIRVDDLSPRDARPRSSRSTAPSSRRLRSSTPPPRSSAPSPRWLTTWASDAWRKEWRTRPSTSSSGPRVCSSPRASTTRQPSTPMRWRHCWSRLAGHPPADPALVPGSQRVAAEVLRIISREVSTAWNCDAGMRLSSLDHRCRPLGVLLALEVPRRSVVGEDEAVALHRHHDPTREPPIAGQRIGGLQPEAGAHGRVGEAVLRAGVVLGRPEVVPTGHVGGEPDRMADPAGLHLVPPQQTGQDRQAGGVRGGPALAAQGVGLQRPGRAGARDPATVADPRVPGLVEPAGAVVDDDRVHVAAGVAAALDARVDAEAGSGPGRSPRRT